MREKELDSIFLPPNSRIMQGCESVLCPQDTQRKRQRRAAKSYVMGRKEPGPAYLHHNVTIAV